MPDCRNVWRSGWQAAVEMKSCRQPQTIDRILVIKPSSLGDILHLFPALAMLHDAYPAAKVDFLVHPAFAPILDYSPCPIEKRILFRRQELGRVRTFTGEFIRLCRKLRKERYGLILDFQGLFRSAVFAGVAGIAGGCVAGFARPREKTAKIFYNQKIEVPLQLHAVERYAALVNAVTGKNAPVPMRELPSPAVCRNELQHTVGTLPEHLIALIPGARWESKKFPPELFAEIIRKVHARAPEYTFAVLGTADEREAENEIARRLGADFPLLRLTGRTSLGGMMELLRHSALVISNDSGPVHAAAAQGKTVFGLFGPTDPAKTGPYGKQHSIYRLPLDCIHCLKRECPVSRETVPCHRIDAEKVAGDILKYLEKESSR